MRHSALIVSAFSAAIAVSGLSGCRVQMSSKTSDDPPAPSASAPSPTPAPTTTASAQPTPAPAPTGKVEMKGDVLRMPGAIVFDTDKATLKEGSGSEVVLEQLKQYLIDNEKTIAVLRIEGHTDNQGGEAHNLELSGQRALTIKKWLVDHGIPATRLLAVGFGQAKPVAPNDSDEHRALNRRTEFKLAQTYDKAGKPRPYLGMDPKGGGTEFK